MTMATTMVTVNVPDGVFEGQEFMLEYEGQQLAVTCPEGCGPGSEINLEIPVPEGGGAGPSGAAGAPPQQVEIVVPDGCYPGMEFTVDFEGREFNIAVPDGVEPGMAILVEVPPAEGAPPEEPPPLPPPREEPPPPPPPPRQKPSASKYLSGTSIPPFRGKSSSSSAEWAPASSLFAMGPNEGFGREAGDFHVGQLVQVTRSDGSWTYGKIMEYDASGDTYSVMTRAGAKHFVERDAITDDIVVNPSDGSCAQQ